MNPELEKLPDDALSLKKIIASQQQQIDHLQEMLRLFQNELFGRKSEARVEAVNPNQLQLFTPTEAVKPITPEDKVPVKGHTRKKSGRKPLPEDLPRVDVVHDIPEAQKQCACGATLSRIGEDVSEKLDYIPATLRVIRNIRPKYACKCCEGVEDEGPTIKIAPVPLQLIPKSIAAEGLVAHIAVSKFADSLPLYRQEKILARLGVDICRATMANWMKLAAECCQPLIELLVEEIRSGPLINIDESPFQVHNEPGRSNTTKSYVWVFCGGPLDAPAVLFQYHPTRSGQLALDLLDGYQGYIQTDGYAGYDHLCKDPGIEHLGCMVHARRKFMEVNKSRKKPRGKQGQSKGLADEALDFIGELYQIEKYARVNGLSYDQILELRAQKASPILDRFKTWLDTHHSQVPPKSLLGKAIQYALNQWDRLVVYLEAGFLKPDNNVAENAIRPFVLGRKNWLFAGAPKGAHASATMFSLIETAKANGLEPYQYLRYVFEKLPTADTIDDLRALLPSSLKSVLAEIDVVGAVP
jgi:transposase